MPGMDAVNQETAYNYSIQKYACFLSNSAKMEGTMIILEGTMGTRYT